MNSLGKPQHSRNNLKVQAFSRWDTIVPAAVIAWFLKFSDFSFSDDSNTSIWSPKSMNRRKHDVEIYHIAGLCRGSQSKKTILVVDSLKILNQLESSILYIVFVLPSQLVRQILSARTRIWSEENERSQNRSEPCININQNSKLELEVVSMYFAV